MINLYKWMLQLFGWNNFVAEQPEGLRQQAAIFYQKFNSIGLDVAFCVCCVALVLVGVVLYYFWWSNGSSKRFKYRYRIHWWITWLLSNSVIVSVVTPFAIKFVLRNYNFNYADALMAVSLCNFLYAIILFFGLSWLVSKMFPKFTNAACTPF